MSHDEMAAIMGEWNKGELDSFLIEISANILKYKDTDGEPLVEKIRDAAGQKGTGKWTAISALGKIKYYALKNRTIHSSKLSKILAFLLVFCVFIDSYFILFFSRIWNACHPYRRSCFCTLFIFDQSKMNKYLI